jgi:hypothetical protein
MSNSKIEQPSKELLAAIKEGEKLASEPNAQTYSVPQELWDELGISASSFFSHFRRKTLNVCELLIIQAKNFCKKSVIVIF